jgi:hypothetical protein
MVADKCCGSALSQTNAASADTEVSHGSLLYRKCQKRPARSVKKGLLLVSKGEEYAVSHCQQGGPGLTDCVRVGGWVVMGGCLCGVAWESEAGFSSRHTNSYALCGFRSGFRGIVGVYMRGRLYIQEGGDCVSSFPPPSK